MSSKQQYRDCIHAMIDLVAWFHLDGPGGGQVPREKLDKYIDGLHDLVRHNDITGLMREMMIEIDYRRDLVLSGEIPEDMDFDHKALHFEGSTCKSCGKTIEADDDNACYQECGVAFGYLSEPGKARLRDLVRKRAAQASINPDVLDQAGYLCGSCHDKIERALFKHIAE